MIEAGEAGVQVREQRFGGEASERERRRETVLDVLQAIDEGVDLRPPVGALAVLAADEPAREARLQLVRRQPGGAEDICRLVVASARLVLFAALVVEELGHGVRERARWRVVAARSPDRVGVEQPLVTERQERLVEVLGEER